MRPTTENSKSIGALFVQLKQRGMRYEQELLFIIDGGKGLKKAIEERFGQKALIQRCTWHKRENVLSYLSEELHDEIKKEYHQALGHPGYKEAMEQLIKKLKKINLQAGRSLEELLTLHKLGVSQEFSVSFSTTNCIESLNSQLKKYVGRVTNWSSSEQRYRWVATALLKIETRMRKVDNFKQLKHLKKAVLKQIQFQPLPS